MNGFVPPRRKDLRIAIIGQSVFGQEVYKLLRRQGRNVVGVFTIPDDKNNGRPDPLAVQAEQDGVPVFKFPRWRLKGEWTMHHKLVVLVYSLRQSDPGGVQEVQQCWCNTQCPPILHSVHSHGSHQWC